MPDPWYGGACSVGTPRFVEAESCRFGESPVEPTNRTNFTAQPDFTEVERVGWCGPIVHRGQQCGCHGEVGARFAQSDTRRDLHEDIKRGKRGPGTPLQYRQNHCKALLIEPGRDAVHGAVSMLRPDVWILLSLPVATIWLLTNPTSRDFERVWYH